MDPFIGTLWETAPVEIAREIPRYTRDPIDWANFYGIEEMPGWDYERGTTGFRHFGIDAHFNELSPYVSATRETDNGLRMGVGRTYNSLGNDSVFMGLGGDIGPAWWEAGLATGYEAPLTPFGRVGLGPFWAMPAYDGDDLGGVVGVNFLDRRF